MMIKMVKHYGRFPGLKLLHTNRIYDERGWFSEAFNRESLKQHGITADFVQLNHTHSKQPYTLRGLHYQKPPYSQAKFVRVVRGSILNVSVDSRPNSPGYGQYHKTVLSAQNGYQIFLPVGFLHGILTLEPETEMTWWVDNPVNRENAVSVRYDDPELDIEWELKSVSPILSEKDQNACPWRST